MLSIGMLSFPGHDIHWLAATFPQLCQNQHDMLAKKGAVRSMEHSDHFVQFH
jgi:uncharacterized protein (DUF1810 family)